MKLSERIVEALEFYAAGGEDGGGRASALLEATRAVPPGGLREALDRLVSMAECADEHDAEDDEMLAAWGEE